MNIVKKNDCKFGPKWLFDFFGHIVTCDHAFRDALHLKYVRTDRTCSGEHSTLF